MAHLPGYKLEPLHEGESLVLYRGHPRDGASNKLLVLKASSSAPSPSDNQRIETEFGLAALLDTAWSARPLKLLEERGKKVLLLEDHGGNPLGSIIGQKLDLTTALSIAASVASALRQLHATGLIHNDLKPSNILVDAAGNVRLTGFGRACRSADSRHGALPSEWAGNSLAYISPEQTGRTDRVPDARSDLYAFGVSLYEMVAGVPPFTASDAVEWIHCHIAREPAALAATREECPEAVAAIVLKLLAKRPEDRYRDGFRSRMGPSSLSIRLASRQAHGPPGPRALRLGTPALGPRQTDRPERRAGVAGSSVASGV